MIIGFLLETLWSLPVIAITIAVSKLLPPRMHSRFALVVVLGLILGITYAIALSQVAGPMVFAARIPLLPFMATVGLLAGLLCNPETWRNGVANWQVFSSCVLLGSLWTGYIVLVRKVASTNGLSVVVVKRTIGGSASHWDVDDQTVTLNDAERMRVEELERAGENSIFKPIFSFEEGQPSQSKIILVMTRDVRRPVSFPVPNSGVEIMRQNQDDTWHTDLGGAQIGNNRLILSPIRGESTRIEFVSPFGTQSSEVGVSHE